MKRFHVHVAVEDIAAATRFYATLFGVEPTIAKPDYAKWMLDDPRVNFAISHRGAAAGLDHVGIQVDDPAELEAIHARLERAGETIADKGAATCCYAKSDKGWVTDPAGLSWETFRTYGESTTYGSRAAEPVAADGRSCCAPQAVTASGCGATSAAGAATPARACCAPSAL
jgi:catechol 2,3-dioxygenase-like lactoylglutathione lyase family enzyme